MHITGVASWGLGFNFVAGIKFGPVAFSIIEASLARRRSETALPPCCGSHISILRCGTYGLHFQKQIFLESNAQPCCRPSNGTQALSANVVHDAVFPIF